MSAGKYTPGPWSHNTQAHVISNADGKFVADANHLMPADICLIAAAPDLFEAACDLAEQWDWPHLLADHPDAKDVLASVERLRAAIAQAGGE
jgi:hypothetical protein